MISEIDVLGTVTERLGSAMIPYMLTGSYALAHYARPRMTRDLDFVIELSANDVGKVVAAFSADFYVDADAVLSAVRTERMFNLMHFASGIKVDLIVRKNSKFRQLEFSRRKQVRFANINVWIVSREDLILSKLVWAKESASEQQRRDASLLLDDSADRIYLRQWAVRLDVGDLLDELSA
ncbi:MAG: hypothetical protein WDZ50_08855 [Woeseia sp.]